MLSSIYPSLIHPEVDISDDFVESYKYQVSTDNLEDSGCYVFAVSDGQMIRILASQFTILKHDKYGVGYWERSNELIVEEALIPIDEINRSLKKIKECYLTE
ncbi:MAG: Imm42 family immunity protein [Limnobaculum xujianqingii]